MFNQLYADLEQYLFRWGEFGYMSTVDICNLDLRELGTIDFEDALLRPMTPEDFERRTPTWRSLGVSPFVEGSEPLPMAIFERHDVIGDQTRLEHKSFILYGGGSYSFRVDSDAERLLLALRLAAPGSIWRGPREVLFQSALFDTFNSTDDSDEGFYTRHNVAGLFTQRDQAPLAAFTPTRPVLEHARYLFPLLNGPRLNEIELRLPIRRFGRSFRYDNPEDRFVDLWVGLESLTSNRGHGATARMTKRIAALTEADHSKWLDLQQRVDASYGIRCDILHGRSASDDDIAMYWDQTEEYLRCIINLALQRGGRFYDEELDALVARFDEVITG